MAKKLLIVLTSHDTLGDTGKKTGFWLEELATPYYRFLDAGFDLTLASPRGGQPPLDPKSDLPEFQTDATRRFLSDHAAMAQLASTVRLGEVDPSQFDGVFYPGGHGPLWDLVDDGDSIRILEALAHEEKPIAAVCHGPVALLNARRPDGAPLVAGLRVTGFSNSEEQAVGLTDVVPVSVEDGLAERGGAYEATGDFGVHAVRDGNLITGQNPASSERAANLLIDALSA